MIVTLFTWGVMYMGIVPAPTGITVPWTVPVFFNGIMATNSVRGGILQLVNMLIVFMIWLPFLKALDNMNLSKEGQQS
jgi:PTS system cellobiose-specific IIC component